MISPSLKDILSHFTLANYCRQSRVHPLKSLSNCKLNCYIKRDDELSCSVAGSKMRKYSSIIPSLIKEKTEEALVIGGANSNHVIGISQLLIEVGIKPILFLCRSKQEILKGNALLRRLLIPDEQIHWIDRQEWSEVEKAALEYVHANKAKRIKIIPEGGQMVEALPGALTLVNDIARNEAELGFQFDHIFMDSGTNLTAIGLILGLAYTQHPADVHVVQMASNSLTFLEQLKYYHNHFEEHMNVHCPFPSHFELCQPKQAKSFGSTTKSVFSFIELLAKEEGVLCDPIYNAKLFMEAKRQIMEEHLTGNALIIQSGGTLSLLGFL